MLGGSGDRGGGWGLEGTDRTGLYSPLLTRKIVQIIIIVVMTMMMMMLLVIPPPYLFYIYYTQDTILSTLYV